MYLAGIIIACIDMQPQIEKCADCTRRKFYQQGYQDGLNADKWILCKVELPPKPRFSEDSYLVKTKCVTTPYTAYWNGEKWTDVLDDDIEDVIAWCPIPPYPQPYKKEGVE